MLEAIKKFALHASKANFFIKKQITSAHAIHKSPKPQPPGRLAPIPCTSVPGIHVHDAGVPFPGLLQDRGHQFLEGAVGGSRPAERIDFILALPL
mgnify:CR=1 FL=1